MLDENIMRSASAVSGLRRSIEWKQPTAVAVIAFIIAFARMPDRIIYGFLWGEDGRIFLKQAFALGGRSVFTAYAGYLELIPRLIAFAFSKVGMIHQSPRPFVWISAFVLCSTCAYLFTFARKVMPLTAAWAFGLTPILVPSTGEVWLTITNLQWVVAPALLVLLWDELCSSAAETARPIGNVVRGAFIVIMTLTGPFGLLFFPVVMVCLLITRNLHRSRGAWAAIVGYLIAVVVQLVAICISPQRERASDLPDRVSPLAYIHYPWKGQFLHHMALDLMIPTTWTNLLGQGWPYAALAVAIVTTACLLLAGRTKRAACIAIAAIAAGLWVVGVVRTGTPTVDLKWDVYGGRYFYVPFILMTWAILIALATSPYFLVRFVSGSLLTLIAINSVSDFSGQVWAHPGVLYREETHTWQLIVPPTSDWFVDLTPAQIGK